MENAPEFKIVGDAPEEDKIEVRQRLESFLFDHKLTLSEDARKDVEKFELPKTPEEIELIDFANNETNRLRSEFGLDSYEVPSDNYHFLPSEKYIEIVKDTSKAGTIYGTQAAVFNMEKAKGSLVQLGSTIFHETMHLKGNFVMEVGKDGDRVKRSVYRHGVAVTATQKNKDIGADHDHLVGLEEAIVSQQQKKSFESMMEIPSMRSEKERLNSEKALILKDNIAKKYNIPVDDIIWVGEKENEFGTITYSNHRHLLNYICREIAAEFPDKYDRPEAVFNEFLKAHFTGGLLSIARLVEGAFGEGSFRRLGDTGEGNEGPIATYEALRKAKVRMKLNK